jgi:UDP-N-acetylmuramoyl-tripeptide--D-alanyl-D-alanine ligase
MAEIGSYTEEGHELVGKKIVSSGIDYLIAVGAKSIHIINGAQDTGLKKDAIFHFDTSEEAGRFIRDRINSGDVILVKGSQSMRMEKAVLEIMAEPERAEELLVRQGQEWQ